MRVILIAGTTETARIPGISAAGADPEVMALTPSADAELLTYGTPIRTETVPVSPTGCPTPAVVTRAVRDLIGFDATVLDAGLTAPTAAPTVDIGADPGENIRETTAVETPESIATATAEVVAALPDTELMLAETIPGGTTTALGVLTALGERPAVSSSLPENPLETKQTTVEQALENSGLDRGGCRGAPLEAIGAVGDPVQAATLGAIEGAVKADKQVRLAGGTQQLANAALARHAGIKAPLSVATTPYVHEDDSAAVEALAADLNVELRVTDPGFATQEHVAFERFAAGEAKEGVGMGGTLALAEEADVPMTRVREQIITRYNQYFGEGE